MSKQNIDSSKRFSTWLMNGRGNDLEVEWNATRLSNAIDNVSKMAERYELLRTFNPREFKQLWKENINGFGSFDDLVDKLIEDRK